MTSFFEHQKLSFRKNYIRNLIRIASSDGHLDDREISVLYEIAAKRNLKEWQVKELLNESAFGETFIPESHLNKMNLLFDLLRLVHADGRIDENEIIYLRDMLIAFNLPAELTTDLFELFSEGTPSSDTWREFTESLTAPVSSEKFLTVL